MTATVLIAQIALPLALIAWLGLRPLPGRAGLALQASSIGAALVALALVAQWAVLPWWMPRLYALLWALALWRALRIRSQPVAGGTAPRIETMFAALLLVGSSALTAQALAGRVPPAGPVVALANPFAQGRYLVGNGGSSLWINAHLRTLASRVPRYRRWRGQSHAVDVFGLNAAGTRAAGWRPADPARYAIFGAPLVAPCTGRVLAARGDMPDLRVPQQDSENRLGNHVILDCGDVVVVLAHLQQGSLGVAAGVQVAQGAALGRVGNSGASAEPHLHVHAQRRGPPGAPLDARPLPIRIDGRYLVRGDRLRGGGNGG